MEMAKKFRRHDIDWLRVTAFYLLIFYHAAMIFVTWGYHIKNPETSEWFETWMSFLNQFRLPLLFMISGIGVYFALGFRSAGTFMKERSRRLLIPLAFGMLAVVPPQIYFERVLYGAQYSGYFDFYKTVFEFVPYPEGGSLSWHHLWFVLYIFIYSLVCLPLFLYLRSEISLSFRNKLHNFFSKPGALYLLGLPLLIIYYAMSRQFPETHGLFDDWYTHTFSITLFVYGFLLASIPGLWSIVEKYRKLSFKIFLIPAFILTLFVWGPTFEIFDEQAKSFFYIYGFLRTLFITTVLLTIFGYSRFLLNKPSKFLSYANESVYPFYILHQTVTIAIGYYVVQWNTGIITKFIIVVLVTFAGSLLIYEIFIRRFNIMRLLFGLKPKVKEVNVKAVDFQEAET